MRGSRLLTLLAIPLMLTATSAAAETASGNARVRVLQPINFAILLETDFGQIVAGGSGGTVLLNPLDGTRDCTASGMTCTGSYSVARLILTGSDAIVTITYDPNFTLTGPGSPMTVAPLFVGGSGSQIMLTGGTATIDFGAALTVNPNQVEGVYSGDFTISVNYN